MLVKRGDSLLKSFTYMVRLGIRKGLVLFVDCCSKSKPGLGLVYSSDFKGSSWFVTCGFLAFCCVYMNRYWPLVSNLSLTLDII